MSGHVLALCGGVGGAKLAHGLSRVLPSDALTIAVNTGDDFDFLGLRVCPDLDSVVYALAGLSDTERGWGRSGETWRFHESLAALGGEDWFRLGDRDLAMHVLRTRALHAGQSLTAFTAGVTASLGIGCAIVPMSDMPVRTELHTDEGWLEFQEYFVHRQCRPRLLELRFAGAATALLQPAIRHALERADLRAVILCPSNPFVSVGPLLALPELRAGLAAARAPVIAVTPIVGGQALKGPAAKMMAELALPVTPGAVARHYLGVIDAFVADEQDTPEDVPGITMFRAQTVMHTVSERDALARAVLAIGDRLT
jgi:LPPG:FO 2-phospho-L-lactate transferase